MYIRWQTQRGLEFAQGNPSTKDWHYLLWGQLVLWSVWSMKIQSLILLKALLIEEETWETAGIPGISLKRANNKNNFLIIWIMFFFYCTSVWFGLENVGCTYRRRKCKEKNRKENEGKEINLEKQKFCPTSHIMDSWLVFATRAQMSIYHYFHCYPHWVSSCGSTLSVIACSYLLISFELLVLFQVN